MECACSEVIDRHVTVHTKGLCHRCGRSLWLQVAKQTCIEVPEGVPHMMAHILNDSDRPLCVHSRNPCYSLCGVTRASGKWEAIPKAQRLHWFHFILGRTRTASATLSNLTQLGHQQPAG